MTTQHTHVPRHSAHEDDETTVLPRIRDDDADLTATLPAAADPATTTTLPVAADPATTTILPAIGPATAPPVAARAVAVPSPRALVPPDPAAAPHPARIPAQDGPAPGPAPEPTAPPTRGTGDVVRLVARSFGEVLITLGVVVVLLAGYEIWGKTAAIHAYQNDLNSRLDQAWGNPIVGTSPGPSSTPGAPPPGWAIGRLYIPKLNLHWVVVEGVALKDIRYAPGHYPGTAMPGQVGNFSVAGHREPGIFWDLDRVGPGDYLVVETRTTWYVYQVFQNHIVTPHSVEVVAPVPNQPGVKPTQKDMTLTTCNPKWDNYQRMAVHARLVATYPHSVRPTQLGG